MRVIKIILLLIASCSFMSCSSGYKMIEPTTIDYNTTNESGNVKLEYKYDLLHKKYAKKEEKKGVKLVAIRITNNSGKAVMFGRDATLTFENGTEVYVMENQKAFKTLKQSPASYLWYLLLTPINLYPTETKSSRFPEKPSTTPIGVILGPGLAGGNMIAASSANTKFKQELLDYNLNGNIIKNGETKYGLIGIKADSFDALKLKIE